MYPYNHKMGQKIQTDVDGVAVDRSFMAHFQVPAASAVLGTAAAAHAAIACAVTPVVVTTAFTNPAAPRNVTATAGGTAGDIKAVQVVVEGTNYADEVITETLPAFTVDTAGIVTGSKAFKTITKVTIPAMDGAGATVTIGFGAKLGLPYKLTHNTVLHAFLDNAREGTAPTVTVSATALESNTITLNSALNAKIVDAYLIV